MTTPIDYEATGPNYAVDKLLDVRERVHQAIAAVSAKIAPGSHDIRPNPNLWVLEMAIRHPTRPFGAFYEDLLLEDQSFAS